GHPDYICDAIMDAVSVALSQAYLDECGVVLHHNVDKGLLTAGRVRLGFGGGKVIRPMELTIGDRATFSVDGRKIPVRDITVDAAKRWISSHLRFVDPEHHLRYRVVMSPGSQELTDIFSRPGTLRVANDTSAAVGFYPLTPTENVVLDVEKYLNSARFKQRFPETGEDIKVMGLRRGRQLDLTVAMPLLANAMDSESAYFDKKKELHAVIERFVRRNEEFSEFTVHLNALDVQGRGLGGVYLSLLGTSAEDADSGQVGRGNRVNGLISLNRPLGTEAAAGKNPVSHVGKIYNVLAHRTARRICEKIDGVKEAQVLLLSRIGSPVNEPQVVSVQVRVDSGVALPDVREAVEALMQRELAGLGRFCADLARGRYPIC
ncbi:MAG: methionine adenosyltransferase, partial [Pseudomonadota bacterium]